MKAKTPPIPIAQPCTAKWSNMTGDERRRLCAQCDKHVHNLSALSAPELRHFAENRNGTECIAYVLRPDGTMVTAPRWPRLASAFQRVRATSVWLLAALLPSIFSGCAQRYSTIAGGLTKGTPLPGSPMIAVERTARPGADGHLVLGEAPTITRRK